MAGEDDIIVTSEVHAQEGEAQPTPATTDPPPTRSRAGSPRPATPTNGNRPKTPTLAPAAPTLPTLEQIQDSFARWSPHTQRRIANAIMNMVPEDDDTDLSDLEDEIWQRVPQSATHTPIGVPSLEFAGAKQPQPYPITRPKPTSRSLLPTTNYADPLQLAPLTFKQPPSHHDRPTEDLNALRDLGMWDYIQTLTAIAQGSAEHSAGQTSDQGLKRRLVNHHNKIINMLDEKNRVHPIMRMEDERISRRTLNLALDLFNKDRLRQRPQYFFSPAPPNTVRESKMEKNIETVRKEIRFAIGNTKRETLGGEVVQILDEICRFSGQLTDEAALKCLASAYGRKGVLQLRQHLNDACNFNELAQKLTRAYSNDETGYQQRYEVFQMRLDYNNIKASLHKLHSSMSMVYLGEETPESIVNMTVHMATQKLPRPIFDDIFRWIDREKMRGKSVDFPAFCDQVEYLMGKVDFRGKTQGEESKGKARGNVNQVQEVTEGTQDNTVGTEGAKPKNARVQQQKSQDPKERPRTDKKDNKDKDDRLAKVEQMLYQLTTRNLMTSEQRGYPKPMEYTRQPLMTQPTANPVSHPPRNAYHPPPLNNQGAPAPYVPQGRNLPPNTGYQQRNNGPRPPAGNEGTFRPRVVHITDGPLYDQAREFCSNTSKGDFARCYQSKVDNLVRRGRLQEHPTLKTVDNPDAPPYHIMQGRYHPSVDPFYDPVYIEFSPAKFSLTEEVIGECALVCYRCFEPTCGANSNRCAYAGKPQTFSFCARCRRGFHDEAECLCIKVAGPPPTGDNLPYVSGPTLPYTA